MFYLFFINIVFYRLGLSCFISSFEPNINTYLLDCLGIYSIGIYDIICRQQTKKKQTNKQTNKQPTKQASKQASKQANKTKQNKRKQTKQNKTNKTKK